MAGSLEGPLAKLARAEAQLETLRDEILRVFPRSKRWPVRTEADRSSLEYRFYVGDLPSVEPDWAFSAGEIMFNLRAALDYLVYELHLRRYRGNLPPGIEKLPEFPIYRCRGDFRERRIERLSQRDRRALRNLQPYIARNDKWTFVRHWLSRLNELHIVDKHRKLHLVTAAQNSARIPKFAPEFGLETEPNWGAVEPHAKVETWTFAKAPPNIEPHPGAMLEVTLQHGGEHAELIYLLGRLAWSTRSVLKRFEDRFER